MLDFTDILSFNRRHSSFEESQFIQLLLAKLGEHEKEYDDVTVEIDGCGNIWVEQGSKEEYPYLFVAHIDTVHKEGMQVKYSLHPDNKFRLSTPDAGCLGADDAVGLFCNLAMLKAGVQGTYLFTRGEESGLIGASYITEQTPKKLEGFKLCVEVDRRGCHDIIVEQCTGKCASEEFAEALAISLDMKHVVSYNGIFTDNSVFNAYIPECVNIAAGYDKEHSIHESVDIGYVMVLVTRLINTDWSSLPIKRDVKDVEGALNPWDSYNTGSWLDYYGAPNDYLDAGYGETVFSSKGAEEFTISYPEKVAMYLYMNGVSPADIQESWMFGKGL